MHALRIPTTRALSLISLPELPVYRESIVPERAAIVARAAPSFLRIGCFEALVPPQGVFFIGMGQQQGEDWEAVRLLGEWVSRLLGIWDDAEVHKEGEKKPWARELVLEVARRNARMVAAWQAYGFMHGVINTDKSVSRYSMGSSRIEFADRCPFTVAYRFSASRSTTVSMQLKLWLTATS